MMFEVDMGTCTTCIMRCHRKGCKGARPVGSCQPKPKPSWTAASSQSPTLNACTEPVGHGTPGVGTTKYAAGSTRYANSYADVASVKLAWVAVAVGLPAKLSSTRTLPAPPQGRKQGPVDWAAGTVTVKTVPAALTCPALPPLRLHCLKKAPPNSTVVAASALYTAKDAVMTSVSPDFTALTKPLPSHRPEAAMLACFACTRSVSQRSVSKQRPVTGGRT